MRQKHLPLHVLPVGVLAMMQFLALSAGSGGAPATKNPSLPLVLPAVGQTVHYRITRTAQGNTGAKTSVNNITLRRKSATALTLKGIYDRPSDSIRLNVDAAGVLQVPVDDKVVKDGASLNDVVNGLNRLTELFVGENSVPRDGWSASVAVADVRGAAGPLAVPIAVVNANAVGFEVHGVGQMTVQAPLSPQSVQQQGEGRRPFGPQSAFRGGNGFAGDALPAGAGRSAGSIGTAGSFGGGGSPPRQSVSVAVSVDGRFRNRAVNKISIVETRSVTVDDLPYVNVSGWTIEASK